MNSYNSVAIAKVDRNEIPTERKSMFHSSENGFRSDGISF